MRKHTICDIPLRDLAVARQIWMLTVKKELGDFFSFENLTFEVRKYDWVNPENNTYHFYHKPSGLKIAWEKEPMQRAMANMDITAPQLLAVFRNCVRSLHPDITEDERQWWYEETTDV